MGASLFDELREKLINSIIKSIDDHVHEPAARDFYLWSFSKENQLRERWLYLVGVTQLVQLTLKMFHGLVDGKDAERLLDYSLPMNVYQFYEIVSDNLSIGLGSPIASDDSALARREVLLSFNQAMVARLNGSPASARELLSSCRSAAGQIPALRNTLGSDAYTAVALHYLERPRAATLAELNGSVFPLLVANIETCRELCEVVKDFHMGPLTTHGLVSRYQAVSALLCEPEMCLSRRAIISADAILVVPTLSYYVCLLLEAIAPAGAVAGLVRDGLMGELLFTAALLLRLLNDLGTPLLADAEIRTGFLAAAQAQLVSRPSHDSLARLLCSMPSCFAAALTRLHKDITHGEINLCMFGLSEQPAGQAFARFAQRLDYLAALYARSQAHLAWVSAEVDKALGDERPSRLVRRFVRFHEELYANPYTEQSGEYTG
jgi:hypothetical protein